MRTTPPAGAPGVAALKGLDFEEDGGDLEVEQKYYPEKYPLCHYRGPVGEAEARQARTPF